MCTGNTKGAGGNTGPSEGSLDQKLYSKSSTSLSSRPFWGYIRPSAQPSGSRQRLVRSSCLPSSENTTLPSLQQHQYCSLWTIHVVASSQPCARSTPLSTGE